MSEIAEHYSGLGGLYQELGSVCGWFCPGNVDFVGWYKTQPVSGDPAGEGRPWALGNDFAEMRDELDRVLYSTVNYVQKIAYADAWQSYTWGDDGREWQGGENPMMEYSDLKAYAPFADIDLTDDVKKRRPEGDIPRDAIETALERYIQAFAELAGGREHVFCLDSVGGAYVFIAPTATAPFADLNLPEEHIAVLFEDMMDKLNGWLGGVAEKVNGGVPAVEGVFEPDLLNNKNRLYKAPLSVHSSLDGVVTPVEVDNPRYQFTPLEESDSELEARATEWASEFTEDHRAAAERIAATLWPSYVSAADTWREGVKSRVSDLVEQERERAREEEQRVSVDELPDDIDHTDDIDVVTTKIEAIDVREVARKVADDYDTAPGRDPVRFNPSWRHSDSGESCFVDSDKFVDLNPASGAKAGQGETKGGGALKLVAISDGIITRLDETLEGIDYWRAVNRLRELGFDVPYFTGKWGTHPDGQQLIEDAENDDEARRQVLRAMKVGGS